ncbi:cysteine--tRNA ligase [Deltaproteobacteria bacterium]|nr:cysteine--tRNA ligase [Deltaproteobacteria bacterium]
MIRVYNTLSRSLEPLETREEGKVGLYVCGMTVYDYCHIGHARAMMAFDVMNRYLKRAGYAVNFVRNHTDVDDKILNRARETGVSPLELSAHFIAELERDLDAVGLQRPTVEPRVSEHIPEVVAMIAELIRREHAYVAENGDVYFSIERCPGYGKLSGKRIDEQREGARVAVESAKRHPGDFALWKSEPDPADLGWEASFGRGRPGWHIECSAMAAKHLGPQFDIHGGGIDLVFPHHENEIAQSECASGLSPFARYWLHNGHLTLVDAEGSPVKMSKSLGNVVQIRDVVQRVPAEALRLLYVDTHYRSPLPYSDTKLNDSLGALDRVYVAKETVLEVIAKGGSAPLDELPESARDVHRLATGFADKLDAAMSEDFNSATAMGHFFELVRAVNRFGNDKKARAKGASALRPAAAAFDVMAEVFGVGGLAPGAYFDEAKVKRLRSQGRSVEAVDAKVAERSAARAGKDWARADALRIELEGAGIAVMDDPAGSTWRVRVDA